MTKWVCGQEDEILSDWSTSRRVEDDPSRHQKPCGYLVPIRIVGGAKALGAHRCKFGLSRLVVGWERLRLRVWAEWLIIEN